MTIYNLINISIAILLLMLNILSFSLFALDKSKAREGKRRISEKALMLSAAFFGGLGALMGMKLCHHKTLHNKFRIGVPLLLTIQLILLAFIIYVINI